MNGLTLSRAGFCLVSEKWAVEQLVECLYGMSHHEWEQLFLPCRKRSPI